MSDPRTSGSSGLFFKSAALPYISLKCQTLIAYNFAANYATETCSISLEISKNFFIPIEYDIRIHIKNSYLDMNHIKPVVKNASSMFSNTAIPACNSSSSISVLIFIFISKFLYNRLAHIIHLDIQLKSRGLLWQTLRTMEVIA